MPIPSAVGRFNRAVTNRLTRPLAGRLPGFGIVVHRGRRTGREYRTPVNVFYREGGFVVALTYGRGDWVQNVLHDGRAQILTRGHTRTVVSPRVVDRREVRLPGPVESVLSILGANEVLSVEIDTATPQRS